MVLNTIENDSVSKDQPMSVTLFKMIKIKSLKDYIIN